VRKEGESKRGGGELTWQLQYSEREGQNPSNTELRTDNGSERYKVAHQRDFINDTRTVLPPSLIPAFSAKESLSTAINYYLR
jgi:hypothetical protein